MLGVNAGYGYLLAVSVSAVSRSTRSRFCVPIFFNFRTFLIPRAGSDAKAAQQLLFSAPRDP
jgi:hypothetical protein